MDRVSSSPIRTPDQRLRVFVSSTLEELSAERSAVRDAIGRLHLIPVMFELGARPHAPRSLYRAYLAQSHVFVGIYWQRYGWVAEGELQSGLEDEYLRSSDMPKLLYLKEPASDREPRLDELLERMRADDHASYKRFDTADHLAKLVEYDLAVLLTERFEAAEAARSTVPGSASRRPVTVETPPPVPLTRTVGRDDALGQVVESLAGGTRLVTITGPGGAGKSRLALEVCRGVDGIFPDGVHFVPLEPVSEASGVMRAIADRLGIRGEGRRELVDTVVEQLADRRLLLYIDNFEHVVDAGPTLASLLDRAPGVHALVSSRQPLRVRGEHEYPLGPLQPDAAVELFLERARAIRPDLPDDDATLDAVRALVERLDLLPLAIELAAARVRLLPPVALLARLQDRTDLLAAGANDLPERQRTLRSAIDWSYQLLDQSERRVLEDLSVFAGGASLAAAEMVCSVRDTVVFEIVSSLFEKSLLRSSTLPGTEPRLQLLFTVRAFAAERLDDRADADEVRDRHADWCLEQVATVDFGQNARAHEHFDLRLHDIDDIRAAMDRVVARGDVERTVQFASGTWLWFWQTGRLRDAAAWFEEARLLADSPNCSDSQRRRLRGAVGHARQLLGDASGSLDLLLDVVEELRERGAERDLAAALLALAANAPHAAGDQARRWAEEACAVARDLGDDLLRAYAESILGTYLAVVGDLPAARIAQDAALAAARRLGFGVLEAACLQELALVEALQGDVPSAWDRLAAAAELLRSSPNRETLGYLLETAGVVLATEGHVEPALEALLGAEAIRRELGMSIWPVLQPLHDDLVRDLRERLGSDADRLVAGPRREPWTVVDDALARRADDVSSRRPVLGDPSI